MNIEDRPLSTSFYVLIRVCPTNICRLFYIAEGQDRRNMVQNCVEALERLVREYLPRMQGTITIYLIKVATAMHSEQYI